MNKVNEMGCASGAGMQLPIGMKRKKKKIKEMLEMNPDISIDEVISYFTGLNEDEASQFEVDLETGEFEKVAEMVRLGMVEKMLRPVIRQKVREIVRKKEGGGGYTLYAPNPGKGKEAKGVGDFPTKLGAKAAELSRFPPKDPALLQKKRKEIDRLRKDPKKAAEKEKSWGKAQKKQPKHKKAKKRTKKEMVSYISDLVVESLFREEKKGSDWDEYISKLSKQAVLGDKKFQSFQKVIEKKTMDVMKSSLKALKSALGGASFEVKERGINKDEDRGITYLEFFIGDKEGTAEAGPFYVVVEGGYPKMEIPQEAKASLTKIDPERGKLLRAELITVQEQVLDKDNTVADAVKKRDDYLNKMEAKLDKIVSGLSSLEITVLKRLMVSKYRKIS